MNTDKNSGVYVILIQNRSSISTFMNFHISIKLSHRIAFAL